jgi:hypothetical protein
MEELKKSAKKVKVFLVALSNNYKMFQCPSVIGKTEKIPCGFFG